MKNNTPLSILTATFGLFFAHVSLGDGIKAPAKYYDRQDLPERSIQLDLPDKEERDTGINDIKIDRDALLKDERFDDRSRFNDRNNIDLQAYSLSHAIDNAPVQLEKINDVPNVTYQPQDTHQPQR